MARDFKREITNKEQILGDVRNAIIEKQEALIKDVDQRTDYYHYYIRNYNYITNTNVFRFYNNNFTIS